MLEVLLGFHLVLVILEKLALVLELLKTSFQGYLFLTYF